MAAACSSTGERTKKSTLGPTGREAPSLKSKLETSGGKYASIVTRRIQTHSEKKRKKAQGCFDQQPEQRLDTWLCRSVEGYVLRGQTKHLNCLTYLMI